MGNVISHPISFIGGIFHGCYTDDILLPSSYSITLLERYYFQWLTNPVTGKCEPYYVCKDWDEVKIRELFYEWYACLNR